MFAVFPEILSLKEIFRSLGACSVLVSGSGSSVFSVFSEQHEAEGVYEYLGTFSEFDVFFGPRNKRLAFSCGLSRLN